MAKRTKIILTLAGIVLLAAISADAFWVKVVRIDGQLFLARTPISQKAYEKGLGGQKHIGRHSAMLFKFSRQDRYAFWMKGMDFDLDIIWVADGRIVHMKKNFSAASSEIVESDAPADDVLEVRAGTADQYGFKVGDRVDIY